MSLKQARTAAALRALNMAPGFPELTDPEGDKAGTTLGALLEREMDSKRGGWKNPARMEAQWRSSFRHATNLLAREVASITTLDALTLLEPLREVPSIAKVLRGRLSGACERAILEGLRADDPFALVGRILNGNGKKPATHHEALPWSAIPSVFAKLLADGSTKALCLAWQILTATRPGEAAGTRLEEIEGDVWTIPAARMKASREHRIPLSPAALKVVELARPFAKDGFLFISRNGSAFSYRAANEICKKMGFACKGHGFRSTFRDWCGENSKNRDFAEAALAHTRQGVEGAYYRSDLFEGRCVLMAQWAEYVAPGEVAFTR